MKGFTFIETLVSVAIMGLMIGGGVFYVNRVNSLQRLDATREGVLSSLREARNLAITNQKPAGYSDPVTGVYMTITSVGTVDIKPNSVAETTKYSTKNIGDDNISIGISGGPIGFDMYTGKLSSSSRVEITISSAELSSGEDKKITINSSGLIDEE